MNFKTFVMTLTTFVGLNALAASIQLQNGVYVPTNGAGYRMRIDSSDAQNIWATFVSAGMQVSFSCKGNTCYNGDNNLTLVKKTPTKFHMGNGLQESDYELKN